MPELSEIYNLLDQDYNQRNLVPVQNASAFQTSAPSSVLSINAAQTHYPPKQNIPICSHCGYNGHIVDTCYKIHGYPVGFKHKGKQSTEKSSYGSSKGVVSSKPIIAQLAFADSAAEEIGNLSKDQIFEVIAYFNSKLSTSNSQVNYMAS